MFSQWRLETFRLKYPTKKVDNRVKLIRAGYELVLGCVLGHSTLISSIYCSRELIEADTIGARSGFGMMEVNTMIIALPQARIRAQDEAFIV